MGLIARLTSLAALALTIVGYQNCSKPFAAYDFDANGSASLGDVVPTPTPKLGKQRVFLATGHMGRTVYSCDDGITWIGDRSDDATDYCATHDCDHTASSSRGLAAGDGVFYANFGWGYNGSLRRTQNGKDWTTLRSDGWGPGVSWVRGQLYLAWNGGQISQDEKTWSAGGALPSLDHPRFHVENGEILAMSSQGGTFAFSNDGGTTWTARSAPTWAVDVAKNGSTFVAIGTTDTNGALPNRFLTSRSTDGGLTWTDLEIGTDNYCSMWRVLYDGSKFVAFQSGAGGPARVSTSVDGATWTTRTITGVSQYFNGALGLDRTTKTWIFSAGSYASQKLYRSVDGGATWVAATGSQFRGGHPMIDIASGEIDAAGCP